VAERASGNIARLPKWWKRTGETADGADVSDLLRRLARINENVAVPIEIADGHIPSGPHDSPEDEADPPDSPWRVRRLFLEEAHHRQYGRPWAVGKYAFEFVVEAGLRPEHRLLDFGCGALRLGKWAISYLEAGNYFGVEAHLMSLEAATAYEIPVHGLEEKRPRLLWNDDFELSHFGTTFDCILDYTGSKSMGTDPTLQRRLFSRFAEVLEPGGRLLYVPDLRVPAEILEECGWRVARRDVVQRPPLFQNHEDGSFKPDIVWNELVLA
jgi:SAM-dependent methyltransferase